jgi:hypothetical protein
MEKTFTVSQNSTLEPIDSHEQKTRFPDIGNIIVAQEADEKYEQTTRFPDLRNIIVAQEADEKYEQTTSFTGIRNIIVAQEADKKYEQTTPIPSIIGMNSQGCIVPCARFFAVACDGDISCTNVEILSAENKTGIISPCKGATV